MKWVFAAGRSLRQVGAFFQSGFAARGQKSGLTPGQATGSAGDVVQGCQIAAEPGVGARLGIGREGGDAG